MKSSEQGVYFDNRGEWMKSYNIELFGLIPLSLYMEKVELCDTYDVAVKSLSNSVELVNRQEREILELREENDKVRAMISELKKWCLCTSERKKLRADAVLTLAKRLNVEFTRDQNNGHLGSDSIYSVWCRIYDEMKSEANKLGKGEA